MKTMLIGSGWEFDTMVSELLRTKLHAPRVREGLVDRPRLLALLEKGLRAGIPFTLVSAPAGYGKTTLTTAWLGRSGVAWAWLSLDVRDNDPARFLSYLIEALRTIHPGLGQEAMGMLTGSGNMLPVRTALVSLLNELMGIGEPIVLVLDDFHAIDNGSVVDMVQTVLDQQPPCLHLVMLTREDPALSLPRLRVRHQMTEIRMDDLRFDPLEAGEFLAHSTGLPLGEEDVSALVAGTEGWIAGLQLAALSLNGRDQERVGGFIRDFSGSHRYIIDYLMEEVMARMDPGLRGFITRTAVLDRFNADLCDRLSGQGDSKAVINRLEQANLFLVPLDDEGRWYRYHHLFAQFLQTGVSGAEKAGICRLAAEWFASNGMPEEAVRYALASGTFGMACGLIKARASQVFQRGEMVTLLDWLKALPENITDADPDLLGYKAWSLFLLGRSEEAVRCLSIAGSTLPANADPTAKGRLMALRGWLANYRDDAETKGIALAALEQLGDGDPFFREVSLISLGHAQRRNDHMADSTATLRKACETAKDSGHMFTCLCSLLDIAMNLVIEGKRREGMELCGHTLGQYVDGHGRPLPMAELLYIPLGIFEYEGNNPLRARECLEKGLKASHALGINRILGGDAEQVLALVHCSLGDFAAARELLEKAKAAVDARAFPIISGRYEAFLAQLALREGDTARALAWVEASGLLPVEGVTSFKEVPYVVVARILYRVGRYEEARGLLDMLREFDTQRGRYGRLVHVNVIQSLVMQALGRRDEAVGLMGMALDFGAREGYVMPFISNGAEVVESLSGVVDSRGGFKERLLSMLGASRPVLGMAEELSGRELEILGLLAAGCSNEGIGKELFISLGTVKWHVKNIYGKLGVGSRTQAVAKARGLGLL